MTFQSLETLQFLEKYLKAESSGCSASPEPSDDSGSSRLLGDEGGGESNADKEEMFKDIVAGTHPKKAQGGT